MNAWMLALLIASQEAQRRPGSVTKFTVSTDDDFHFESDLEGTSASVQEIVRRRIPPTPGGRKGDKRR